MNVAVLAAEAPAGAVASDASANRHFPELDCVRHIIAPAILSAAEGRAERVAVGADGALVAAGAIDAETYARALAAALGTGFEPLETIARAQCPIDDTRLIECAATGLLPVVIDGALSLVLAPRGIAARRIMQLASNDPDWPKRFRFTSSERLVGFILREAGNALIARARERLKEEMPIFSATASHRGSRVALIILVTFLATAVVIAPSATAVTVEAGLAALFLAWLGLRLIGAVIERSQPAPLPFTPDADLPVYTVIAALYREASSVDGLLQAIARLDYPAEKLDVILAVEADDPETCEAIAKCRTRLSFTVIPVPVAEPRTKPKALNVALPFARGAFTVIYDAEDRPEPNQLRAALETFRAHSDELACVQARLCIDNTADSWLTRLFTAEYAAQFDVFLDGLTYLRLPLPLGGSSNHFYGIR